MKSVAQGKYKVAVVDASTGNTVWEMPDWKPNVILNSGMEQKALRAWDDLFTYAAAGTGSTPTYKTSGTTNGTQIWADITTDGTEFIDFTTDVEINDVLVFGTTSERLITNILNGTWIQTGNPWWISGPQTFSVWHTSRGTLEAEIKRTNTYVSGAPYCQTLFEGAVVKMRRTYNFGAETGTMTYNEVGFGWSGNHNDPLFSRVVLTEPVTVDAGYYLRAFYELQVTYGPSVDSYLTMPISGFSDWGNQKIQGFNGTCTSYVSTSGSSWGNPLLEGLPRGDTLSTWLSKPNIALAEFGTHAVRTSDNYAISTLTMDPYVPMSFYLTGRSIFSPGTYVDTLWAMGLTGSLNSMTYGQCFAYVLNTQQTMGINDQLLAIWQFGWARYFFWEV